MFGSLSTKIAHSAVTATTLGSQELRPLQDAITKEKEIVTAAQRLSKDWSVAAEALKQWGFGEGDDLGDISNAAMMISGHISSAFNVFADHELNIRAQLKEVRTKEEQLDELRKRRRTVVGKLDAQEKKLSKMGPENKGLVLANEQLGAIQNELRQLDTSILVDMARLSDYKRQAMRSVLTLKFGGLAELGETLTIIGELGKLLASETPQDVTPPGQGRAPYLGREATANLVAEAAKCVSEVNFNPNPDADFASKSGHRTSSSTVGASSSLAVPPGSAATLGGGRIGDPSKFRENSHSSLGISLTQPRVGPVDEFGRPLDGGSRPQPLHATMPSLGGGSGPGPASPIQQLPLSAIQQSMRGPSTAGSEYAPGSAGGGLQIHGGYGQPGPGPSTIASSSTSPKFHAPPPPPALSGRHQPRPSQPSSSTAPQMAGYPNSSVTVERGLTLSLPLRSRSGKDEDEETDSPFAPPNNPSGAPSAFKAPPQQLQQPARQGTTDSDIVLGGDAADLKRTTTLPPTLKMDDLPTWSFGLGELGMESPTKTQAKSELDKGTDAPTSASKSLPNEPSKDEVKKSVTPLSAVPRGLQEGTNSASQTPLTQTPTTYLDNQSSAGDSSRQQSIATSPDTPVIHHHVVDDPTTRGQGNSGRFAMFPDKRKPTLDSFPVHLGSMISSGAPEEDSPRSQHQHDQQPKSILVDSTQQSRSGTQTSSTGHYDGASGASSKIHFAPRPPSPITPSPVTGDSTSEEASAKERTDKDDRRLSAITPLGLHKNKDGSQPTTPHHGAFLKEPTLSEDQFNAMLDSFEEQLGSPNMSSNAPTSAPESGADTSIGSNASKRDDSMSSTGNVVHTRGLEAANESSLDSTAAVAGSPFPSPTPTNTRPAQSFSSMSATSNNSNSLGGFTGIGSATYGAGGGRRPPAREPTEDDDSDSSPVKTISAGAFKRGGAPKQGHSGPTPSLNPAPTVSPPIQARATSGGYTDGPRSQDYHTDHEDTELPYQSPIIQGGISQPSYFPPAAPPSRGSDQGHSDYSGAPSVYQTPQETPNFGNLPPGAAAPARFGPPQGEQASYNQSQRDPSRYSNQSLSYSGSMEGHSPRLAPPPIPSSLLPARPGSAAPLASIGHVPSSPNRQISPPPNSSPYMSPSYAPPRGTAVPPWQQQPQQYRVPSPMNDGNVGIHDAYGGISNEPAYDRAPAGGQGSWNSGASSYNPNQAPRGWNGS